MIVQESTWGMTQVKGSEKVPATPSTPTGTRQYLDQECPSTRNTSESQHILAKYTRYLKSCSKGKSLTDLGIFQPTCQHLAAVKNVVTSTFQAIQIAFTKDTSKSSEHLANCNFANLLVCRTNGYHLTTMLQLKLKPSISENHFQICRKLGLLAKTTNV